jgi:hypothetical protein
VHIPEESQKGILLEETAENKIRKRGTDISIPGG